MAWAPNPPAFYKHFTAANVDHITQLKKEHDGDASKILDLPSELRFLVPPTPPTDQYRLFNRIHLTSDYLRPLPETGTEQLYPSPPAGDSTADSNLDRGRYLKQISRSILLSFLELMGIFSEDPNEGATRKMNEITTLMKNAHQLINEYRPHQARESLIIRMEQQIEKGMAEVAEVQRMKEKIEGLLREQVAMDVDVELNGSVEKIANGLRLNDDARQDLEAQRKLWDAFDTEFPAQTH